MFSRRSGTHWNHLLIFHISLYLFKFENITGGVPSSSQEYELIDDLLCVLMGFQGKFILTQPSSSPHGERTFHISTEIGMKYS